jgi:hypothetical protein
LISVGTAIAEYGDIEKRRQYLLEGKKLAECVNDHSDQMIANALFALGKIRATQGNRIEAELLGRKSLALFAPNQPARAKEVRDWLESP